VPIAPMVRVQQKARGRTTGTSRTSGLPCAMVLTLIRDLPGDRLDCPRRPRARRTADLASAPGCQDHTISRPHHAVRPRSQALRHAASIASHPACRDDRDTPLLPRRDETNKSRFLQKRKRDFSGKRWTGVFALKTLANFVFSAGVFADFRGLPSSDRASVSRLSRPSGSAPGSWRGRLVKVQPR
jgi:hypothetical protein